MIVQINCLPNLQFGTLVGYFAVSCPFSSELPRRSYLIYGHVFVVNGGFGALIGGGVFVNEATPRSPSSITLQENVSNLKALGIAVISAYLLAATIACVASSSHFFISPTVGSLPPLARNRALLARLNLALTAARSLHTALYKL